MGAASSRFDALISQFVVQAHDFVPETKRGQLIKRWITPAVAAPFQNDPDGFAQFLQDVENFAGDVMLTQPSQSGSTAFDRMARAIKGTVQDTRAIRALCDARFALLRIVAAADDNIFTVAVLPGEQILRLRIETPAALPPGLIMFGRLAVDNAEIHYQAGLLTPLDEAALAVATQSAPSPGHSREKESRWVEALYCHIVRHGTLRVPGLNVAPEFEKSAQAALLENDHPMAPVLTAWLALGEAAPDAALISQTRSCADLEGVVTALFGLVSGADTPAAAQAFERMLPILLDTVRNRETMVTRTGVPRVSLDSIAAWINRSIAEGIVPPRMAHLFTDFRRRLPAATLRPDDAGMQRLIARIRALREKTVEQGCTEQEALAAAEKVAELLDRHGLTLNELTMSQQPCGGQVVDTVRRRPAAVDSCGAAVAAFFDCRHWTESPEGEPLRHVFFGLRADVAAAEYLFSLVEQVFADEQSAFRDGAVYAKMRGQRHAATKSFQQGLADGIRGKLHRLRQERESRMVATGGQSLVPAKAHAVNEAWDLLGLNLTLRTRAAPRASGKAYQEGREAGARFSYTPGLETS